MRFVDAIIRFSALGAQVKFGEQLAGFLQAAKQQRDTLLDLSADTQLQVGSGGAANFIL